MRLNRFLVFGIAALYLLLLGSMSGLALLDFPNHLTRAAIIADLLWGRSSAFGNLFAFSFTFSPYILHDLGLALCIEALGSNAAGRLWVCAAFALPILGALTYLKICLGRLPLAGFAALLLMYLATDWFFLNGFTSFRFGIGICFFALALWEKFSRSQMRLERFSFFILYAVLVASVYFTHLAAFLFLGVCTAVVSLAEFFRTDARKALSTVLAGAMPLALIALAHAAAHPMLKPEGQTYRGPVAKLAAVGTMFIRFDYSIDFLLAAIFALCLLFAFAPTISKSRPLRGEAVFFTLRCLAAAAACGAVYLVLPVAADNVYDIDNRALPFLFILLVLGAAGAQAGQFRKAPLLLSIAVALLNMAYLFTFLLPADRFASEYLSLIESLPEGKTVLPIAAKAPVGRMQPDLHLGSLYTLYRRGLTPYLFSGDANDPMPYFVYLDRPRAPVVFWYSRGKEPKLTELIDCYDFLIITKPYESALLDAARLKSIASNTAADVFGAPRFFDSTAAIGYGSCFKRKSSILKPALSVVEGSVATKDLAELKDDGS